MIDLTPPNPNPASPDNDQDGPKTARAHFLKVFLSQRPQMEALVSRRVGCRATAASQAAAAAGGGQRRLVAPTPTTEQMLLSPR